MALHEARCEHELLTAQHLIPPLDQGNKSRLCSPSYPNVSLQLPPPLSASRPTPHAIYTQHSPYTIYTQAPGQTLIIFLPTDRDKITQTPPIAHEVHKQPVRYTYIQNNYSILNIYLSPTPFTVHCSPQHLNTSTPHPPHPYHSPK